MQNIKTISHQKDFFLENFWQEKRFVFLDGKIEKPKEAFSLVEAAELDIAMDWINEKRKVKKLVSVKAFEEFGEKFPNLYLAEYARAKMNDLAKLDFMKKFLHLKFKKRQREQVGAKIMEEKLGSDWQADIERLDNHIKKLGVKNITNPDLWFQSDRNIKEAYEYFFGEKEGVIRRKGKNIFGSDIAESDSNYLKKAEERLLLIQAAYTKETVGKGKGFLEAKQDTKEKNKNLRENMIFQVMTGNFQEAVKTFKNAPKEDKWKYAACAGILAIGLFKLFNYARKKYPKTTMGALILYSANTITGMVREDKKTILEGLWMSKEKPDDVTAMVIEQINKQAKERGENQIDDSEEIRATLNFGGVKVSELWKVYKEAKSTGNKNGFQKIFTKNLKREDGKNQWVQPEVAFQTAEGYFNHIGRKYFNTAKDTGYLTYLIQKNKKEGKKLEVNGETYDDIPTNPLTQKLLGVGFFMDRYSSGDRDLTYFGANWTESFNERPASYFLSIPDFIGSEFYKLYEWWANEENQAMIAGTIKKGAVNFKEFAWDRGIVESWNLLKPHLIEFKDDPITHLKYAGNQIWEFTLESGAKLRILIGKGIDATKNIYETTVEYWKDDVGEILDFWKKFHKEYYTVKGKEVVNYWIEKSGEGWALVIEMGGKLVKFVKNSAPVTASVAAGSKVCEWTVYGLSESGKAIHSTAKEGVDWVKRIIGLEKLSNITTKELNETLDQEKGIEAAKPKIKTAINKMASSPEMREIFEPLIPLMKDTDEDIGALGLAPALFETLFTGNGGPVNENQWASLVSYKQHEMLLFYQNLLVEKAKDGGGNISESEIKTIEKNFKDYLEKIAKGPTLSPWVNSNLEEILKEAENAWWTDTDAENYRNALTGLLALGTRNETYPATLEKLASEFKKIDFVGQAEGKYTNQLKAITLWKFAEMAAPIAMLDEDGWFSKKEFTKTHEEYLSDLSAELLRQLIDFENNDFFDKKVDVNEVAKIFRNKLNVSTFKEYKKNGEIIKKKPVKKLSPEKVITPTIAEIKEYFQNEGILEEIEQADTNKTEIKIERDATNEDWNIKIIEIKSKKILLDKVIPFSHESDKYFSESVKLLKKDPKAFKEILIKKPFPKVSSATETLPVAKELTRYFQKYFQNYGVLEKIKNANLDQIKMKIEPYGEYGFWNIKITENKNVILNLRTNPPHESDQYKYFSKLAELLKKKGTKTFIKEILK